MHPRLGTIGFDQYKIQCIIGTQKQERLQPQEIKVNLRVETDINAAIATDDLANTINYMLLAQVCEQIAIEGQYHLLEAYAAAVLDTLMKNFKIRKAWIKVSKAQAIASADYAFVELTRE